MPGGRVSSNIMMLSPVSCPRSFKAKERPGVGSLDACRRRRYDQAFFRGQVAVLLIVHHPHSAMPLSASSFFALSFLVSAKSMPRVFGRLGELDVRILDDLEPVAPRIEEIEERAFDKTCAGGLRQFGDVAAVIDDKAEMPLLDAADHVVGHQGHVDQTGRPCR